MKFRERVSVVCLYQEQILCFRAIDPLSGQEYYFIPGGKIENNETLVEAAQRETLEETGYRVQIRPETQLTARYPFHWNGEDFDCLTHFYRVDLTDPWRPAGAVADQPYNKGPCWRDIKNISQDFAYSEEIREAVVKLANLP